MVSLLVIAELSWFRTGIKEDLYSALDTRPVPQILQLEIEYDIFAKSSY